MAGCDAPEGTSAPAAKRVVAVAAAADLQYALPEIADAFSRRHPHIALHITFGSSGNFYSQLSSKAPFDIFFSADLAFPDKLIEQGAADGGSRFHYAVGQIVVWARRDAPLDVAELGINALNAPSVRKIAIANPRHAPYGRAAEAAMKNLGVYEQAKDRLVLGENVAQTAQFVESGSADVGIIALALALAPAMKDKGQYALVPIEAYPRLEQGGVIMSWARDREAADALRRLVLSDEGKTILKKHGFFIPGD